MGMAGKSAEHTTVMVVDDDESIVNLVSGILESAGYKVLKAKHSDEALDISSVFKDEIDILVTDVKMDPFMTGFQLAQCLRLMRVEIKVLYISGYVEDEMVRWEVESSVAGFLQKPFNPQTLLERIQTQLAL
ncbi:MAG: domain S-box protein [Fibrobacteres bacterium]|nr:domain S-box protein [Fibrobacterota bacterium]